MKSKLFAFFLILLACNSAMAYNIIAVTKSDKGLFGYRDVSWQLGATGPNGNIQGWVGNCSNPGLSSCRPPSIMHDNNDYQTSLTLLDYAENQIDKGIFNGSYEMNVQVEGENEMRTYTVTWSCDEKGDGTIIIDRIDE